MVLLTLLNDHRSLFLLGGFVTAMHILIRTCRALSNRLRPSPQQIKTSPTLIKGTASLTTSSESALPSLSHRPWIQVDTRDMVKTTLTGSVDSASQISVATYNILGDCHVKPDYFKGCPPEVLDWNYRSAILLDEIVALQADVIALQEVETQHYHTFFKPTLGVLCRYESIFEPKSKAKFFTPNSRKTIDGCAIFYRADKYKLIYKHLVEYQHIALALSCSASDMLNRLTPTDNIGIAVVLECKRTGRRFIVANTHLHWRPDRADVKIMQTIMLINELSQVAQRFSIMNDTPFRPKKSGLGGKTHPLDPGLPLILMGDFNSMFHSGVIRFIEDGRISSKHREFTSFKFVDCDNEYDVVKANHKSQSSILKWNAALANQRLKLDWHRQLRLHQGKIEDASEVIYKHDFWLRSAYEDHELLFTNLNGSFCEVIDYIYYSGDDFVLQGLLGPLDERCLSESGQLPQEGIPSDHIPLKAVFEFSERNDWI